MGFQNKKHLNFSKIHIYLKEHLNSKPFLIHFLNSILANSICNRHFFCPFGFGFKTVPINTKGF